MGEIRIVRPGKTHGYPYPVCKNIRLLCERCKTIRLECQEYQAWSQRILGQQGHRISG